MCPTSINSPNKVEIQGVATLCFDESGTWFKGSIESDDQTQYAIHGIKSTKRRQNSQFPSELPCGCFSEYGEELISFNVRVIDCDVGQEYNLKKIHAKRGDVWSFCCDDLKFTCDQVFRGQKADMVTKQFFGQGAGGVKTVAFLGPIEMKMIPKEALRHWVL